MYFSGKNVKMELGVCKGKKLYDKREDAAKKAEARDIERYERGTAKKLKIWARKGFDGALQYGKRAEMGYLVKQSHLKINANNRKVALAA